MMTDMFATDLYISYVEEKKKIDEETKRNKISTKKKYC